jgi:hypothetical protein
MKSCIEKLWLANPYLKSLGRRPLTGLSDRRIVSIRL